MEVPDPKWVNPVLNTIGVNSPKLGGLQISIMLSQKMHNGIDLHCIIIVPVYIKGRQYFWAFFSWKLIDKRSLNAWFNSLYLNIIIIARSKCATVVVEMLIKAYAVENLNILHHIEKDM